MFKCTQNFVCRLTWLSLLAVLVLDVHGPSLAQDAAERQVVVSAIGSEIEVYPGSEKLVQHINSLLKKLRQFPTFATLVSETVIIVSPPGEGLEAIRDIFTRTLTTEEGVAFSPRWKRDKPMLAIRSDSVAHWNLGMMHEFLHLLEARGGPDLSKEIVDALKTLSSGLRSTSAENSPSELFAYLGQWYVAGYGELLKDQCRAAYDLCVKLIGEARIDSRGTTRDQANSQLKDILAGSRLDELQTLEYVITNWERNGSLWAKAHFKAIVTREPKNWVAWYYLGVILQRDLDEPTSAKPAFDGILRAKPTSPSWVMPWTHVRLGMIAEASDDTKVALRHYQQALGFEEDGSHFTDIARKAFQRLSLENSE